MHRSYHGLACILRSYTQRRETDDEYETVEEIKGDNDERGRTDTKKTTGMRIMEKEYGERRKDNKGDKMRRQEKQEDETKRTENKG